jgi:5'-phosphate synthase pdxT subunit
MDRYDFILEYSHIQGPNVKVLAKHNEKIVAIQEGKILATAFHPELTHDDRFHRYFVSLIA